MSEALQATLAAEHAAVWTFGVLGGQTSESGQPGLFEEVSTAYTLHRSRRDQLIRWIRDDGKTPVPADVAYELPADLGRPARVREVARRVETRCVTTYAVLVSNTGGDRRSWAVRALVDAATREVRLGGDPEPMPGY